MNYEDSYIYARDIDWFCIIGGIYCHFASAGGKIPEALNDRTKLRHLQKYVYGSDYLFKEEDLVINSEFLAERFENNSNAIHNYLRSFIDMARKGFVSFDRTNLHDWKDSRYHVVCYPKQLIEGNLFKDLIQAGIPQLQPKLKMGDFMMKLKNKQSIEKKDMQKLCPLELF